jgi:hypothetical protein
VHPYRVVDGLRAKWLNPELGQRLNQVADNLVATPRETRCKATPEGPTGPLKNSLARHIVRPLARAVELVTVTLDGQAATLCTLDNKVNPKASTGHLRLYAVASLDQLIEHVKLEPRFTALPQVLNFARVLPKRLPEMPDEPTIEGVFLESCFGY